VHKVLQNAIDHPRMPGPTNYADTLFWWQYQVTPRKSYMPQLLLLNGETERRVANDNEKGGIWPLYNEYDEKRLGRDADANARNWQTAIWFDSVLRAAEMPQNALPAMHMTITDADDDAIYSESGELADGFEAIRIVPTEAEIMIAVMEKIATLDGKKIGKLYAGSQTNCSDWKQPRGVERRSDALKIQRMLQVNMRGLYKPVRAAVVEQTELWRLGITEGVSRGYAATAGRQRVIDGLEIAADIRRDVMRWEEVTERLPEGTCSPLGRKADELGHWRQAANDDCRTRGVPQYHPVPVAMQAA
jgi:hypothetical protein